MTVERVFWWLPRPSKSKYIGSFPLHFEIKLCTLLEIDPKKHKILHPFGGGAEFGDTVDLPSQRAFLAEFGITPTFWGDAHDLHWIEDNTYDLVVCDPPYSNAEAKKLYSIDTQLKRTQWISEAKRVCKNDGYIALYHRNLLPRPKGCSWEYLIAIATRIEHHAQLCGVFRKKYPGDSNGLDRKKL